MRTTPVAVLLALSLAACGPAVPPEGAEGAATTAPPKAAEPMPAVNTPPPQAEAPKLSPEEEKKKAELAKLAKDMEEMEAAAKKEAERFDAALRAEAKALAEASYPTMKAALTAAMKSRHRTPGDSDRDAFRHPIETLDFFGVKPTSTVLELGAGGGWYTELLAPALAKKGKLLVTGPDPAGPETKRTTLYGKRLRRFLDKSPELYGKIEVIVLDAEDPKLPVDGTVDVIVAIREVHGWQRRGKLDAYVAQAFKALKPGGVFGVVAHRAKPDANPDESVKQGYLPEPWLIKKVEAAGFKLAAKSEVNANPKDTKDHPEGVWTLPPSLDLGDKDRAKYVAIGESDRMTLKFTKPR